MHNQEEVRIVHQQESDSRLAPLIPLRKPDKIEFENDFGETPLGLAHLTKDQGFIAVTTLVGAFVGSAIAGVPFALVILAAGLNDIRYAGKKGGEQPKSLPQPPIFDEQGYAEAIQPSTAIDVSNYQYNPSTPEAMPTLIQPPVRPQPQPITASVPVQRPSITRSAYTLILDNPFQSLAIFGAQRTGKSYFVAILSQELHRLGIPIYAINLARYGQEDDVYWCHCVKSVMGDISEMRPYDAKQLIEQAIDVVEEFYSQPRAILIFDEWAYAGSKNNAHAETLEPLLRSVADKLSVLTSTGIKRGRAIWTIAPEFVAKDLQPAALSVKKSKLLYVTIAPGKSVDWNGNEIKFDDQLFSQVKYNYTIDYPKGQRFNQDRICYLNKEWIEMGDLPPLDPNLRPVTTASAPSPQAAVASPAQSGEYSAEEKKAAEAAMVSALRETHRNTLWEFVRDELGVDSSEEIKETMEAIAGLIFEYELTGLKDKFRLNSPHDIRYSYSGYGKNVAQVHRLTNNVCCCCLEKPSEQVHHTRYLGAEDQAGENEYPVCRTCHESECHSKDNWVRTGIWTSHSTSEWEAKLKQGMLLLQQGGLR